MYCVYSQTSGTLNGAKTSRAICTRLWQLTQRAPWHCHTVVDAGVLPDMHKTGLLAQISDTSSSGSLQSIMSSAQLHIASTSDTNKTCWHFHTCHQFIPLQMLHQIIFSATAGIIFAQSSRTLLSPKPMITNNCFVKKIL